MKVGAMYSHLNGLEYLQVHKANELSEILEAIESVDASLCLTKVSKEKTKLGKTLYSPTNLNSLFKTVLNSMGWHESRKNYYCTKSERLTRQILELKPDEQKKVILENGENPILSYSQTDFFKNEIAIEVQFGKYSFVAFDIFVKHMGFFVANELSVGVEILPMKSLLNNMSSGPSYYEREIQHIIRQGRGNPPVPLLIIGIEP